MGREASETYTRKLGQAIQAIPAQPSKWRRPQDERFSALRYIRCEHHLVFFRQLTASRIGIVSILHESMDIPHPANGY